MTFVPASPMHPNQFKTLNLLRLYERDGSPVFFIVGGSAINDGPDALDGSYFFDDHSCPTNYVHVEAIFTPKDDDPHGVFEYVRSVWMPADYDDENNEEMLRELFPETSPTP